MYDISAICRSNICSYGSFLNGACSAACFRLCNKPGIVSLRNRSYSSANYICVLSVIVSLLVRYIVFTAAAYVTVCVHHVTK